MNLQLAEKIISMAVDQGVREFCVCAGARNAPFVMLLASAEGLKVYNLFDERAAGFFALGRIQSTGRPVAVVTTSGTAVAELLPAAVEATYTGLPLLLISADRPRRFRGSGAPQTIEQVGIFSHYSEPSLDVENPEDISPLSQWTQQKPFHLNVCLEEPLIDGVVPKLHFHGSHFDRRKSTAAKMDPQQQVLMKNPVVLVGSLPAIERGAVVDHLLRLNAPIYAESLSGLRGEPRLQKLLLKGGEKTLAFAAQNKWIESAIRIGGVPTVRFWRDLEQSLVGMPVASVSETEYTGLSRPVKHFRGYLNLSVFESQGASQNLTLVKNADLEIYKKMVLLLEKYSLAEPALVHRLSFHMAEKSLYLGNSLPIREWDLVAGSDLGLKRVLGNRGANGIDGQISTFLGWCNEDAENWALIGDLTAMYDLSSLWMTSALPKQNCRVVIINNGGGQIFKSMFNHEAFLNQHQIQFQKWAEMWNWSYRCLKSIPGNISDIPDRAIIEIQPDSVQTELFWREYRTL